MREITTHHINECNRHLPVVDLVVDGLSHHYYKVSVPPTGKRPGVHYNFDFQQGPIKENGVNGITNEALLAIVLDRMEHFQRGEFKCRENALVITKLQEAMHWLDHRTHEREERGVEGTNTL
jgi:hypothetical protein